MESKYASHYVKVVMDTIEKCNESYNNGFYFTAVKDLLPLLKLLVVKDDYRKKLDELIDNIKIIPRIAKSKVEAHTSAYRRFEYNHYLNIISIELYLEAIDCIRESIRYGLITTGSSYEFLSVKDLDFTEIDSEDDPYEI